MSVLAVPRLPSGLAAPPADPVPLEDRVIDAALRCVARWGIAKTTLDDVAREAGCSRATVYRVVPGGKDGLIEAVATREATRFFAALAQRLDAVAGPGLGEGRVGGAGGAP